MNSFKTNIGIATFCSALLLPVFPARAAFPDPSGTWGTKTVSTDTEILLEGDIDLTGTITVSSGKKLTIRSNGAQRTIKVINKISGGGMFKLNSGSTLELIGAPGDSLILDGGANFNLIVDEDGYLADVNALTKGTGGYDINDAAISVNQATLEMNYAVIQNVNNASTGKTSRGGAIEPLNSNNTVLVSNSAIRRCKSYQGAIILMISDVKKSYVKFENCNLSYCVGTNSTSTDTDTGVIRTWGGTDVDMQLKQCLIHHNYSAMCGGSIYANAAGETTTKGCTIDGCEIYFNHSKKDGGGVYASGNITFSGAAVDIHHNKADGIGGGVAFHTYSGSSAGDADIIKQKVGSNVTVQNNYAEEGAGICFIGDKTITLDADFQTELEGVTIKNNIASKDGGGFYYRNSYTGKSHKFDAFVKNCQIDNNRALDGNGGGINILRANITIFGSDMVVTNNRANNGAGVYIASGNVTLNSGLISKNTSAVDGGGVYSNGGVAQIDGGQILENTATGNGGGFYMASGGSVEFKGDISGNTATNGGGLYLASKAKMKFLGGLITNNYAKWKQPGAATTAYRGQQTTNIKGCGGGIYLQKGTGTTEENITKLTFELDPLDKTFGLYSNFADYGGDEIVSEGQYTSVLLPGVEDMQLYGFEGLDANPSWYQDYFNTDGDKGVNGYYATNGHAVEGDVSHVRRFRTLISDFPLEYPEHKIPDTRLSAITNFYLCLTLSYSMMDLTISAKGLQGHETALFKLVRHGNVEKTYDILLMDPDPENDNKASRTLKNMPWGTYSIYPDSGWNYAYEELAPREGLRLGEKSSYEILYEMKHKNMAKMPQHDERQAQGKDVPFSTVEGKKPDKYVGTEL